MQKNIQLIFIMIGLVVVVISGLVIFGSSSNSNKAQVALITPNREVLGISPTLIPKTIATEVISATAIPTTNAVIPTVTPAPMPSTNAVLEVSSTVADALPSGTQASQAEALLSTMATGRTATYQVFFANPRKDEFEAYAVSRTTNRTDVGTFVLEQYLKGPSAEESQNGMVSELSLNGTSNCGERDFKLTIVNQTAIVKFCRIATTPNANASGRITIAMKKTLQQFASIKWVLFLDSQNKCEGASYPFANGCVKTAVAVDPTEAEKIIAARSLAALTALKNKDMVKLAELVHPTKGVRFSPYTYVSAENQVFNAAKVKTLFSDQTVYLWGQYDGSGDPIKLSFSSYYNKFVYGYDYLKATLTSYNKPIGTGNTTNNVFEKYPNGLVVEYYFAGFNPDYEGMDWKSLKLVFEQDKTLQIWYLVGIVQDQWTI